MTGFELLDLTVPRTPILDGEWQQFVAEFEAAGRKAASLGNAVKLLPRGINGPNAFDGDDLKWLVLVDQTLPVTPPTPAATALEAEGDAAITLRPSLNVPRRPGRWC